MIKLECSQGSNLWQQLRMASQLEYDLGDIMDLGKKEFLILVSRKPNLLHLIVLITLVLVVLLV